MNTYNITLELCFISGENPIEAVKNAIKDIASDLNSYIYTVQDFETKKIYSVDMSEYDEFDESNNALLDYDNYEPLIS